MKIGAEGDATRPVDLDAWAAQIAAMHMQVARLNPVKMPEHEAAAALTVSTAEGVRARVLSSREGQMTVQDGIGYLQVAAADLERSQEVLRRMRVVSVQAQEGAYDATQTQALQKYLDRGLQDLEGIAEQARSHTLRMLGGTAAGWALPESVVAQAAVVPPVAEARSLGSASRAAQGAPPLVGADPTGPAAALAPLVGTSVPPVVAAAAATGVRPDRLAAPPAADPASRDGDLPASARAGALDEGAARSAGLSRYPSVSTVEEARLSTHRLDTASDILAQVRVAVDEAEAGLQRTIVQLGLDQVHLPGTRTSGVPDQASPESAAGRMLMLRSAAEVGASTLVDATRAQFQAITAVLGGAMGAAALGASLATSPRDTAMAPRPVVEPVGVMARSTRTAAGRDGGREAFGGGVARR